MGLPLLIFIALSVYLLLIVMDMRGMASTMRMIVTHKEEVDEELEKLKEYNTSVEYTKEEHTMSLSPMARKVLNGIKVNDVDLRGPKRRKYIEDAGYDYEEIKKEINDYYNISIKD